MKCLLCFARTLWCLQTCQWYSVLVSSFAHSCLLGSTQPLLSFWHPQRRNPLLPEVCIFQPRPCWQSMSPSAPALPHTFFFTPGSIAPASAEPCEDDIPLVCYLWCGKDGSLFPAAPTPSTATSIRRDAGMSWLMALHPYISCQELG